MSKRPWIKIEDKLPPKNKIVWCKVEYWRYGCLDSKKTIKGKFVGMNGAIGKPMFDFGFDTDDCYTTEWRKFRIRADKKERKTIKLSELIKKLNAKNIPYKYGSAGECELGDNAILFGDFRVAFFIENDPEVNITPKICAFLTEDVSCQK